MDDRDTPGRRPASRRTPLHDRHVALGATLTDFAGWTMPLKYASDVAEHHAVRQAAGIFDLSHMGEIEVTGPEADQALDYALVGKPSELRVGQARYSLLASEAGGILDDLVVYRLEQHRFLVVPNAGNVAIVDRNLVRRSAGFACHVRDVSQEVALVAVQGPRSSDIVSAATDGETPTLRYYSIAVASVAGRSVHLARTGYTGEDGFEVYCAADDAAAVWGRLLDVGEPWGIVPAGLAARDSLRLEAGMPLYGQELDETVTPYEVGLGRLVRFDKPSGFVGSEALAAAEARPLRRRLVGLAARGRRSPRPGHEVLAPTGGAPVGVVTSGAPSPTLGHAVAMAFVTAELATTGTELVVDIRGRAEPVQVVDLPFYKRSE